jgi:hypothetical protein
MPTTDSRPRVHSIGFDAASDECVDSLAALLREAGFPRSGRSEVVRVAVELLRESLSGRTRAETLKFFLDRDHARQLERLDRRDPDQCG